QHLPVATVARPAAGACDEQVGRFCYWYDENEPPPPDEPTSIRDARHRLLMELDSAGRAFPNDRWISGQRLRYNAEARRFDDAIAAARQCTAVDWWCSGILGFALHVAGKYAAADSAYARALSLMEPRERCEWRDLKLLLDDRMLRRYKDLGCDER